MFVLSKADDSHPNETEYPYTAFLGLRMHNALACMVEKMRARRPRSMPGITIPHEAAAMKLESQKR
ncbi:MAG: hypothetical protein D6820_16555 [Lentisphaerae bacterium]|nr:MAG: hypothetical protein D6820_16555 [Lentisphaerota bacterium]